jgi:hypothetical protein
MVRDGGTWNLICLFEYGIITQWQCDNLLISEFVVLIDEPLQLGM